MCRLSRNCCLPFSNLFNILPRPPDRMKVRLSICLMSKILQVPAVSFALRFHKLGQGNIIFFGHRVHCHRASVSSLVDRFYDSEYCYTGQR